MEFLWQDWNMLWSKWIFAESDDHLPVYFSLSLISLYAVLVPPYSEIWC